MAIFATVPFGDIGILLAGSITKTIDMNINSLPIDCTRGISKRIIIQIGLPKRLSTYQNYAITHIHMNFFIISLLFYLHPLRLSLRMIEFTGFYGAQRSENTVQQFVMFLLR